MSGKPAPKVANPAALEKLRAMDAKMGSGLNATKKKALSVSTADDKKITGALKKVGISPIPGIEEVNFFLEDGKNVLHFNNSVKLQANPNANTYVVAGTPQKKAINDLMPGILSHMDNSNVDILRQLMAGRGMGAGASSAAEADSDDDIPALSAGASFDQQ